MRSNLEVKKSVNFGLLLSLFFFSVISLAAQSGDNQSLENDEKSLRAAIIKIETSPGAELAENFKYTGKRIDLNGDGHDEVVVWIHEENMGGTSGYPILILSKTKNGYEKMLDVDQAWTPVIALKNARKGWRDIAVGFGGGGVEWQYFIYKFNGKIYKFSKTQKEKPQGDLLIEKNWNRTMFGAMPKN